MKKNTKNKLQVFHTVDALNESAAQLIIQVATKSVAARGRFVLCLSGGKTPNELYTLLSTEPFRDLISWQKTFVFWSDERFVPANDERNNAYTACEALLSRVDLPRSNMFPVPVSLPPADSAKKYEETIRNFFGEETASFDLLLLGLGGNGHTASLFPGTEVLHEKSAWVKEVYIEDLAMYRITMTPLLINKASNILFLVTGREKAGILKTIFTCTYLPDQYPVQLIDPGEGELTWYADDAAASAIITAA